MAARRHSLLPPALFLSFGGACPAALPSTDSDCQAGSASNNRHHDLGTAYGTAKAGVGIASMGVMRPDLAMRNIIPVVMAGVLGIYGLMMGGDHPGLDRQRTQVPGFAHLAASLCCGLSGLMAAMAIGVVGEGGVRTVSQQEKLFVKMTLILIFAEALGLYGLIVALILSQKTSDRPSE
ncbi:hypothetical protein PR001_g24739 [Phytophthora rubi]|uniref:V-type proton ATPase proteolipid subunit n=1 Tax=Phytophthora rubi TaxID=129364 RepID=A0A6A3I9M2_9STRA|nr:hypothetical protein PR001_g24739 [Phytophthora rubi]